MVYLTLFNNLWWEGNPVGPPPPPLMSAPPVGTVWPWGFPGEQAWTCLHGAMCLYSAVNRQTDCSYHCGHTYIFGPPVLCSIMMSFQVLLYGELVCRSHLCCLYVLYSVMTTILASRQFSADFAIFPNNLSVWSKCTVMAACTRRWLHTCMRCASRGHSLRAFAGVCA